MSKPPRVPLVTGCVKESYAGLSFSEGGLIYALAFGPVASRSLCSRLARDLSIRDVERLTLAMAQALDYGKVQEAKDMYRHLDPPY